VCSLKVRGPGFSWVLRGGAGGLRSAQVMCNLIRRERTNGQGVRGNEMGGTEGRLDSAVGSRGEDRDGWGGGVGGWWGGGLGGGGQVHCQRGGWDQV